MLRDIWIKKLESNNRGTQLSATCLHPLDRDDDAVYSIMPLMVEKAMEVDVHSGPIDLISATFVGRAAKNAARSIRQQGYSDRDEFHRQVAGWIFELNYCSELNTAALSVEALGELWVPPKSVRKRLIELVHSERRADNQQPGTIRAIAYRMLSKRDRDTAKQLIDTPARKEFQSGINELLQRYRLEFPNNANVPQGLWSEIAWLEDANAT